MVLLAKLETESQVISVLFPSSATKLTCGSGQISWMLCASVFPLVQYVQWLLVYNLYQLSALHSIWRFSVASWCRTAECCWYSI